MKTIEGVSTTTADGDQHSGRFVCETDVTDNSVQYHVTVYGTVAGMVPEICSQIQRSTGG